MCAALIAMLRAMTHSEYEYPVHQSRAAMSSVSSPSRGKDINDKVSHCLSLDLDSLDAV